MLLCCHCKTQEEVSTVSPLLWWFQMNRFLLSAAAVTSPMININIQVIFMDHSQIQRCHLIRRCPFEKPDLRIFISTVDMTCLITPCSLTPVDLTYTCSLRSAQRLEEPMSREDEDFSEHDYYNSIPGKEPPVGGVVDSRLRPSSSMLGHIHSQPQSKAAAQV